MERRAEIEREHVAASPEIKGSLGAVDCFARRVEVPPVPLVDEHNRAAYIRCYHVAKRVPETVERRRFSTGLQGRQQNAFYSLS
jgi:hypothetical protein